MKKLILLGLVISTSAVFAGEGSLAPCQKEAQQAVISIAKINHVKSSGDDLILDLASGEAFEEGPIVNWVSGNQQFTVTTHAGRGEGQCRVDKLQFNPEP